MRINVSLERLQQRIDNDMQKVHMDLEAAIKRTAEEAVAPIQEQVPVAFGELRDSIHAAAGPRTISDAPHAGAVEIGSLPHKPDLAALIRWVKLRGMQGLHMSAKQQRGHGPTTRYQATRIKSLLRELEVGARRSIKDKPLSMRALGKAAKNESLAKLLESKRGRAANGRYLPTDAAERVARAIASHIEKHGTRPHWFMRDSLPAIRKILHTEVSRALRK